MHRQHLRALRFILVGWLGLAAVACHGERLISLPMACSQIREDRLLLAPLTTTSVTTFKGWVMHTYGLTDSAVRMWKSYDGNDGMDWGVAGRTYSANLDPSGVSVQVRWDQQAPRLSDVLGVPGHP